MPEVSYYLPIKPVSANVMFAATNHYYKQTPYIEYQEKVYKLLDKLGATWNFGSAQVSVSVDVGLSSTLADLDNTIKPLLDTFQTYFKGAFNDRDVFEIYMRKFMVKRGNEFLDVKIKEYTPPTKTVNTKGTTQCQMIYT